VAQHSNEHLTTAQLSAYLDKELAPDELALCDAHLATCPTCPTMLADLRLTSTLLHSLPQVAVPRSFALPSNLVVLSPVRTREEARARQTVRNQQIWRHTFRALSTLAAVLGLLLILVGALSGLPYAGRVNNTASAPVSSTFAQRPQEKPATVTAVSPSVPSTSVQGTPTSHQRTPDQASKGSQPSPNQPTGLPLDLGEPQGRLGIGVILLVLGVLGVILTRRLGQAPARSANPGSDRPEE
jgi:anti-sigma factor RsiW